MKGVWGRLSSSLLLFLFLVFCAGGGVGVRDTTKLRGAGDFVGFGVDDAGCRGVAVAAIFASFSAHLAARNRTRSLRPIVVVELLLSLVSTLLLLLLPVAR